jgi:predicted PurR-regulated permease PerM
MEKDPVPNRFSSPIGPHLWEIRAVQDLLCLLGAALLIWLLHDLRSVILPIFVGFLLAYLANPFFTMAKNKWHIPFGISIVLIFVLLILSITGAGIWLVPLIKNQSRTLLENIPEYIQRLGDRYDLQLNDLPEQLQTLDIGQEPSSIVELAKSILGTTTDIILWIILVPIYFGFFAWHFQSIVREGRRYFLLDRHPRARKILHQMDEAIGVFFRGRLLIAVMVGVIYALGWWFANVPYWFLLGAITGFFSIIPYLSIIGWFLALLLKYLDMTIEGAGFEFLAVILWPSLVFGIGNILEGWVFTPWIHGRSTQLNPIMILTIVLIGGTLAGFWGLLFSIPVAICLNILFLEFFRPRLDS